MRTVAFLALLIAIAALAISVWNWSEADSRADAAMKRREKALVQRHKPHIIKISDQMGLVERVFQAETFDDLLEPMLGLTEGLSK